MCMGPFVLTCRKWNSTNKLEGRSEKTTLLEGIAICTVFFEILKSGVLLHTIVLQYSWYLIISFEYNKILKILRYIIFTRVYMIWPIFVLYKKDFNKEFLHEFRKMNILINKSNNMLCKSIFERIYFYTGMEILLLWDIFSSWWKNLTSF